MTKDDILRMAKEAELIYTTHGRLWMDAGEPGEELELFASLVAAEEREACAKLVEVPAEWEDWEVDCGEQGREMCNNLAAAIRARGENT